MKRLWTVLLLLVLMTTGTWLALGQSSTIIGPLPFTLTNGTVADANQVMANFNYIVSQTNTNAANAGVNSNITSLVGLSTPIPPTSGGTSVYYGGTSTNTGNAYTVSSPTPTGFTLAAGRTIIFIASATNTGAATLNVNSTGVTNLFKQSATGPVAMSGGEIVSGGTVTAVYDGTQFQCTNCTAPSLVPTGTTVDFSGVNIPTGWLAANGTAQLRATFPALFAALALTVSATTASSTSVTVPNSALFQIGWYVGGSNVTCNSYITAIPDGTHITINAAAGASGATTLTIGPYQQGDCSTTFNLPNYAGAVLAGYDPSAARISSATCPNPGSIGDKLVAPNNGCGSQVQTLTLAQLPTGITAASSNLISGVNLAATTGSVSNLTVTTGSGNNVANSSVANWSAQSSIIANTTSNNTGGASHPILQPTSLTYKIIKT